MEHHVEPLQNFSITPPKLGDEHQIGPMHVQGWMESYERPELGFTKEMLTGLVGHMATDLSYRRNTLTQALANPKKILYRVVKNGAKEIVGFMHGTKHDTHTMLEAIYLLDEAKGTGVADTLMHEFLAWADKDKPCTLEVFTFNEKALRFYARFGFVATNQPVQFYKDKMPFIEMKRLPQEGT